VFGFLGPNGSGKTTTLRILTGLAHATSGSVRVLGAEPGGAVRSQIGFLPDVPAFYEWMTAPEFLTFAGELCGEDQRLLRRRTGTLLEAAGLAGVTTRIGSFSRGMRQRLGIAQALINAPRLLLLDEPTSALDPIGRKDVLDLIAAFSGRTTVFFSTHILADVERVCDTVAVLDHGRVLTQAPIQELTARYATRRITVQVTDGVDRLTTAIRAQSWVSAITPGEEGVITITVSDADRARREVPALIAAEGIGLIRFEAGQPTLEEAFIELIGGAKRQPPPGAIHTPTEDKR